MDEYIKFKIKYVRITNFQLFFLLYMELFSIRKTEKFEGELPFWVGDKINQLVGMLWLFNRHKKSQRGLYFLEENTLIYNKKENKLYHSKRWYQNFIDQLNDTTVRFIIIYLGIKGDRGHANMLIIDKVNKTIERFEPHGSKVYNSLDITIEYYFLYEGIIDKYIPPKSYCTAGPQAFQCKSLLEMSDRDKRVGGYCLAWTLWYTDIRLSYPDLSLKELDQKIKERFDWYQKQGISKNKIIKNFGYFIEKHRRRILSNYPSNLSDNEKRMIIIEHADSIK